MKQWVNILLKYKAERVFFLKSFIYIIFALCSTRILGAPTEETENYATVETRQLLEESCMIIHEKIPALWDSFKKRYHRLQHFKENQRNDDDNFSQRNDLKVTLFLSNPIKRKKTLEIFKIFYELVICIQEDKLLNTKFQNYTSEEITAVLKDDSKYFKCYSYYPGLISLYFNTSQYKKNKSIHKENFKFLCEHGAFSTLTKGDINELHDYARSIKCGRMEGNFGLGIRQYNAKNIYDPSSEFDYISYTEDFYSCSCTIF